MVGDELVMDLNWEQGRGRETQVQPPVEAWRQFFDVDDHADSLPKLRLVNVRAHEEDIEPPRRVVRHHHNLTLEVAGARGGPPSIARFISLGRGRYEYAIFRPADVEYGAYDQLLRETHNPYHTGGKDRRWFIARVRPRRGGPWRLLVEDVERAVTRGRRAAAEEDEVEAARDEVAKLAGKKSEGQGYASLSARRKAIEDRAMAEAARYFSGLGYKVRDVSRTRSYDLECSRAGSCLHVEVKGTTSLGGSVLLTANEVVHAHVYPATALFVLAGIRLSGDPPKAHGGRRTVLNPWVIDDSGLKPLAFSYQLR